MTLPFAIILFFLALICLWLSWRAAKVALWFLFLWFGDGGFPDLLRGTALAFTALLLFSFAAAALIRVADF